MLPIPSRAMQWSFLTEEKRKNCIVLRVQRKTMPRILDSLRQRACTRAKCEGDGGFWEEVQEDEEEEEGGKMRGLSWRAKARNSALCFGSIRSLLLNRLTARHCARPCCGRYSFDFGLKLVSTSLDRRETPSFVLQGVLLFYWF